MNVKIEIAVIKESDYKDKLKLSELGIDAEIDDSQVETIEAWINTDNIEMVETAEDGYNIRFTSGDIVFSKLNPLLIK